MKPTQKKEVKKGVKKEVQREMKHIPPKAPEPKKKKAPPGPAGSQAYHREEVKNIRLGSGILAGAVYTTDDISFNAGNAGLFPRMAQIAATYQYYRVVKWRIQYLPIASVFGANQQGMVCLSLLENWYDPRPDTMVAQTERSRACKSHSAWLPFELSMPPTPWRVVRDAPSSQGQDMRLDDCVVEVGVEGFAAAVVNQVIGYLYLTAEVEFRTPYTVSLLHPPRTNKIQTFVNNSNWSMPASPAGTDSVLWFNTGSGPTALVDSYWTGVNYTVGTGGDFTFQGGTYLIIAEACANCAGSASLTLASWVSASAGQNLSVLDDGGAVGPVGTTSKHVLRVVITVPEGAPVVFNVLTKAIQAASTAISVFGVGLIVVPF